MKKRIVSYILICLILVVLTGCGSKTTTITIFAAKSLNVVLDDLISRYEKEHPEIQIATNYDSSGTLMTQIREARGDGVDLFFSAAVKQMDQLQEAGLLVENTRKNIVNNQVCVVTYKGSNTNVTGLSDLHKADSIALAGGSVPVGRYTRQALVNAGILVWNGPAEEITSSQIKEALGGVEINECANVGAVTAEVSQGSNEVGTVYYSDTYGLEEQLVILEIVPYELTGNVIYPLAQIENKGASEETKEAARAFLEYLSSSEAAAVFEQYYFDALCK